MASKPSNAERATWRDGCRVKLADHLHKQLGLTIAPEDVRLITGPSDQYQWYRLNHVEHLFRKQLSKHSLRDCRQLHEEIGVSIWALPKDTPLEACQGILQPQSPPERTFPERIQALENQNAILKQEVTQCRDLQNRGETRCHSLHKALTKAEATNTKLKNAVKELHHRKERLQKLCTQYQTRIQWVEGCLEELTSTAQRIGSEFRERPPMLSQT